MKETQPTPDDSAAEEPQLASGQHSAVPQQGHHPYDSACESPKCARMPPARKLQKERKQKKAASIKVAASHEQM